MTWVAAAVGVAGVAVTVGKAVSDGSKKRKDRKANEALMKNRPQYEIPQEIFQNQAMYEAMAGSSRLPGQNILENNIGQSTAQAIGRSQKTAGSSADLLSSVTGIQANQNEVLQNMSLAGMQQQQVNKDKLAGSRETVSDYKNQKFDYNKNQMWKMKYAQLQKEQDQAKIDQENTFNNLNSSIGTIGGAVSSSKK